MGFFTGRATFARYRVEGPAPKIFTEEHLDKLSHHAAGKSRIMASDGVEFGWSAGEHILDVRFELAKNIINDYLYFGFRIDTVKLPSDLLRAYYAIDLAALCANNPSGFPSNKQKKEAKASARERLEHEAKDGRYTRRKVIECAWDLRSNELLFGTTSLTQIDRLLTHFKNTFGYDLIPITAGSQAYSLAEIDNRTRNVEEAIYTPFGPHIPSGGDVAWALDETNRNFVGNEFLVWLWYMCHDDQVTIPLSDESEVVVMIARTLTLECPRAQTGRETITHDMPFRLPEAVRALQSGKLPRKAGLTLVRHDIQYELSFLAEQFALSGVKIPPPEEDDARANLEARADQLRALIETVDLLYQAFCRIRFSAEWPKILGKIQRWLAREGIAQAA